MTSTKQASSCSLAGHGALLHVTASYCVCRRVSRMPVGERVCVCVWINVSGWVTELVKELARVIARIFYLFFVCVYV